MLHWQYIDSLGAVSSPQSEEQIIALIDAGSLDADSLLWSAGLPEWTPLRRTQLASYLPSPGELSEQAAPTAVTGSERAALPGHSLGQNSQSKNGAVSPYLEDQASRGERPQAAPTSSTLRGRQTEQGAAPWAQRAAPAPTRSFVDSTPLARFLLPLGAVLILFTLIDSYRFLAIALPWAAESEGVLDWSAHYQALQHDIKARRLAGSLSGQTLFYTLIAVLHLFFLCLFLLQWVRWQIQARRNLESFQLRRVPSFSNWLGVLALFVPVIQLVVPYYVYREIAEHSVPHSARSSLRSAKTSSLRWLERAWVFLLLSFFSTLFSLVLSPAELLNEQNLDTLEPLLAQIHAGGKSVLYVLIALRLFGNISMLLVLISMLRYAYELVDDQLLRAAEEREL